MNRSTNLRADLLDYSSDEEHPVSDDSILDGVGKHQVGVAARPNDNYAYVDAMTNRLNETDARLLRAAIGEREGAQRSGDNEGGQLRSSFTNE